MSRPLLRTLSITHLRSIFVLFLFLWTRTLISLSPTDFTAVSVNHCRSSVLNMNRIWGSVSKFSRNQATCLQTWRLRILVQCRKPAARCAVPMAAALAPHKEPVCYFHVGVLRDGTFQEIPPLVDAVAAIIHCVFADSCVALGFQVKGLENLCWDYRDCHPSGFRKGCRGHTALVQYKILLICTETLLLLTCPSQSPSSKELPYTLLCDALASYSPSLVKVKTWLGWWPLLLTT